MLLFAQESAMYPSEASFTYGPDLLLTKIIGRAPITCRPMLLEYWRTTGFLNRFEETQKYARLYKGK